LPNPAPPRPPPSRFPPASDSLTLALVRFISNWCVIAICLVCALPTILAITEPTEQEAAGDFLTEDEDAPGKQRKLEAAEKHTDVIREKVATGEV